MEIQNIYLNLGKPAGEKCLFDSILGKSTLSRLFVMRRDKFPVRIWPMRTNGLLTSGNITHERLTDLDIVLGVKEAGDLDDANFLTSQTEWTEVQDGNKWYYEALVDFNTSAITTAFSGKETLLLLVDIRLQNADNSQRITYQFPATLRKNGIAGTEGGGGAGDPMYPVPSELLLKSGNLAGLDDVAEARVNLDLGQVDDTSDADKPISNATQTALDEKASQDELDSVSSIANSALPFAGGTMTGAINMGSNAITNLPAPSGANDAVRKAYVDGLIDPVMKAAVALDCSANPNYPAAQAGDNYRVTVAGKVGGASGPSVNVGDLISCHTDTIAGTEAAVGANWFIVESNRDQSTESVLGLTRLATNAEALAGSDHTRSMTPQRVKEAIDDRWLIRTGSFTAARTRHYIVTATATVTDPAGTTAGDFFVVVVGGGTLTLGGVNYSASRFPLVRFYNGSTWSTLSPTVSDNLVLNGTNNTAPGHSGQTPTSNTLLSKSQADLLYQSLVGEDLRYRVLNRWTAQFDEAGQGATQLPQRVQLNHSGRTSTRVWIYSGADLGLAANDLVFVDHTGTPTDSSYYVVSAGSFTAPNDTSVNPVGGPTNGSINWQSAYGGAVTVYWAELATGNAYSPSNLAADTGYSVEGRFVAGITLGVRASDNRGTQQLWVSLVGSYGGSAQNMEAIVKSTHSSGGVALVSRYNDDTSGPQVRCLPLLTGGTFLDDGKMVAFVTNSTLSTQTNAVGASVRAFHVASRTSTGTVTRLSSYTGP